MLLMGCSPSPLGLTSSSGVSCGWDRCAFCSWGRGGKEEAGCAIFHRYQMWKEWEYGGAEERIFEGNLCATCAGSISLLPVQTLSSVLLRCREWCPRYTTPPATQSG